MVLWITPRIILFINIKKKGECLGDPFSRLEKKNPSLFRAKYRARSSEEVNRRRVVCVSTLFRHRTHAAVTPPPTRLVRVYGFDYVRSTAFCSELLQLACGTAHQPRNLDRDTTGRYACALSRMGHIYATFSVRRSRTPCFFRKAFPRVTTQRIESGRVGGWKSHGTGRMESGQKVMEISRVGPGHPDTIRPARRGLIREKPCKFTVCTALTVVLFNRTGTVCILLSSLIPSAPHFRYDIQTLGVRLG